MSYAEIDSVIQGWARDNSLTLNLERADQEARFCYVGSGPTDVFQISVEPPQNDLVKVNVWTVDCADDLEAHLYWVVPASKLRAALDVAQKTIRDTLKMRPRFK